MFKNLILAATATLALAACANGSTQTDPYAQRIADASVACSHGDQHACIWYRKLVEAQGAWSNAAQQQAERQADPARIAATAAMMNAITNWQANANASLRPYTPPVNTNINCTTNYVGTSAFTNCH
jgi:hypothetical protein